MATPKFCQPATYKKKCTTSAVSLTVLRNFSKTSLLYFQIWKSKKVISCFSQLPLDMLQPETTSNTRNVTKIKVLCKLIWTDREQKVKAFVFHCEFMSLFPLILLLYGGIITVPEKKLYFQRTFSSVSMSNHQWLQLMIIFPILGWTSGANFIDKKKTFGSIANALNNVGKTF